MENTVESIWIKAQRLSPSERLALSRRLKDSITETKAERECRVAREIDGFFGGWCNDGRTTEEIMSQIRSRRTENNYLK